jgi:hypothetical protein
MKIAKRISESHVNSRDWLQAARISEDIDDRVVVAVVRGVRRHVNPFSVVFIPAIGIGIAMEIGG